jgi:hypothetical protein
MKDCRRRSSLALLLDPATVSCDSSPLPHDIRLPHVSSLYIYVRIPSRFLPPRPNSLPRLRTTSTLPPRPPHCPPSSSNSPRHHAHSSSTTPLPSPPPQPLSVPNSIANSPQSTNLKKATKKSQKRCPREVRPERNWIASYD